MREVQEPLSGISVRILSLPHLFTTSFNSLFLDRLVRFRKDVPYGC